MESRKQQASQRHKQGYNCCQSVFCTYADLLGLDEATAFRVSEGFGLGFGGQKEVCGAVSGMTLAAGCKNSSGGVEHGITKQETHRLVNDMIEIFKNKNGSALCRDLLGSPGHPKLRSCDGCIEDACSILEAKLFNNNTP